MKFGSYIASFMLHAMLVLLFVLWPSKPRLDLSQAVQISLVDGAPGGEMQASPVLGREGDPSGRAKSESRPKADTRQADAAPPPPSAEARPVDVKAEAPKNVTEAPRPESVPKHVPAPPPPPDDAVAISEKKAEPKPEPKPEAKPETKPAAEQPKSEPKQAQEKKAPEASREDAIKAALADARKDAKPEPNQGQGRQDAIARAMADMRRQSRKQGTGGGGAGEGDGPGGGGLKDVYLGMVIMAVRPNWSTTTFSARQNLMVRIRIKVDAQGNVLDCYVEQSSGNPGFDGSAVNAVKRTGTLPPPPDADYQEISINFNSQDALGR